MNDNDFDSFFNDLKSDLETTNDRPAEEGKTEDVHFAGKKHIKKLPYVLAGICAVLVLVMLGVLSVTKIMPALKDKSAAVSESYPETPVAGTLESKDAKSFGKQPADPVPAEASTVSNPSFWSVCYYVDDFGDKTDDFYVGSETLYGTFSNSAVFDEDLLVSVLYDENNNTGFRFSLFEYGRSKPIHFTSDELLLKFKIDDMTYSCSLRAADSITGDLYTGTKNLTPGDVEALETMRSALMRGTSLDCLIYIGDSKYLFHVPSEGFYDAIGEYISLLPD